MRARPGPVICLCVVTCCGCGKHQKTTAELLDDLKGPNERDRLIAVRLVPDRKGDAARVVPALVEALKDKADDIRISAAIGLGSFGDQAKEAVPALKAALHDRDFRVREAATHALAKIDPSATPKSVPKW
jgi:HEAT repeat protein